MQGYKPDAQVNLVCDEDHHFEDEELSREKMLKCSEEGDWNGLGDSDTETPLEWDCGIRCVREYSSALGREYTKHGVCNMHKLRELYSSLYRY